MDGQKTSFKDLFYAFVEYMKRPKTMWDIKDRLKAGLLVIGTLGFLTWYFSR